MKKRLVVLEEIHMRLEQDSLGFDDRSYCDSRALRQSMASSGLMTDSTGDLTSELTRGRRSKKGVFGRHNATASAEALRLVFMPSTIVGGLIIPLVLV